MTAIPQLPPPPDIDRMEFRRSLIDDSAVSERLNPELTLLVPWLAAVAGILRYYPDL